jgi:hypothetical protein
MAMERFDSWQWVRLMMMGVADGDETIRFMAMGSVDDDGRGRWR